MTSAERFETTGQVLDGAGNQSGSRGATTKRGPARAADRLGLSIFAAVAGTILTSFVNGSPRLKLAAALAGAALPAFVTGPGRHQRQVTRRVGLVGLALKDSGADKCLEPGRQDAS